MKTLNKGVPEEPKKFDSNYLDSLISKAKKSWEGVDTDDWINNLRGEYE